MTSYGSRRGRRLVFGVGTGLAFGLAALTIIGYQRHLQDKLVSSVRVPDQQSDTTDTVPVHRHSAALSRRLARLSPFDMAIGDVMGGLVPIGDVTEAERSILRRFWERVLAPDFCPRGNTAIEWRKVLWSEVRWEKPDRRGKKLSPPQANRCTARWAIDGSPLIVHGGLYPNGVGLIGITISLTGTGRVRCEYPRLWDLPAQGPFGVIVTDIDKSRLLSILTNVFRFPWKTVDDFVVTWTPSPTSAGHLRIQSSRRRQPGDRERWFDEVALEIGDGNPQKVSMTIIFLDL